MIDILNAVKDQVTFSHYFDGSLWYKTSCGDIFPVPIDDIGVATFNCSEKGILMMRYMRKYNEMLEENE